VNLRRIDIVPPGHAVTVSGLTLNPRPYKRFSDAAQDVIDARIYEGIHYRTADVVGVRTGSQVANWAFAHFLRSVE
jgi:hypothetical protein